VLDGLQERLPDQARSVVAQAREQARSTRDQVRERLGRASAA
jgi:hypothetical protein